MNMQEVNSLIETFSAHGLTCLELEEGNMRICMKKELQGSAPMLRRDGAAGQQEIVSSGYRETGGKGEEDKAAPALETAVETQAEVIRAPLVGLFYNASSPEDEPYVKVGDTVKKGQVIGIIEAMKLMNEVTSGFDGVVGEIMVENGQVVEYGQPLLTVCTKGVE